MDAFTSIVKGDNVVVVLLSETLIIMSEKIPVSLFPGCPVKIPDDVSKEAHLGLLVIEYERTSPSGSIAVGLKS